MSVPPCEQTEFFRPSLAGSEQYVPPVPPVKPPQVFDICRGRHGGNAHSENANAVNLMNREDQQARVLDAIRATGVNGLTCKELAKTWDVGMNTISGRFSELKAAGLITPALDWTFKPVRRDGAGAYMAARR